MQEGILSQPKSVAHTKHGALAPCVADKTKHGGTKWASVQTVTPYFTALTLETKSTSFPIHDSLTQREMSPPLVHKFARRLQRAPSIIMYQARWASNGGATKVAHTSVVFHHMGK